MGRAFTLPSPFCVLFCYDVSRYVPPLRWIVPRQFNDWNAPQSPISSKHEHIRALCVVRINAEYGKDRENGAFVERGKDTMSKKTIDVDREDWTERRANFAQSVLESKRKRL